MGEEAGRLPPDKKDQNRNSFPDLKTTVLFTCCLEIARSRPHKLWAAGPQNGGLTTFVTPQLILNKEFQTHNRLPGALKDQNCIKLLSKPFIRTFEGVKGLNWPRGSGTPLNLTPPLGARIRDVNASEADSLIGRASLAPKRNSKKLCNDHRDAFF